MDGAGWEFWIIPRCGREAMHRDNSSRSYNPCTSGVTRSRSTLRSRDVSQTPGPSSAHVMIMVSG